MQTHTIDGNEGTGPMADHGLARSDHGAWVPDHVESVPTHGPAMAGRGMPLAATDTSKGASGHDAFDGSEDSGERFDAPDTSPLRVSFTVQYTDFGMERLYGELAALKTDVERMRHVKRCLLDIVRGDFHRAPLALPEVGDFDRESFKLHVRLSTRDTGLDSLYQELKPLATVFKRNTYLRRRLYDAFTANGEQPPKPSVAVSLAQAPAPTTAYVQSLPATPLLPVPSPDASAADRSAERREAIRKHNKSMFSNS